jgi:ADP-dependent phosphofructokinase/glucokinase
MLKTPFSSVHAFCAFNSNVDYVTRLTGERLSLLGPEADPISRPPGEVSSLAEIRQCVEWSTRTGEAVYVGVKPAAFKELADALGEPDEKLLGGQAGIMANNLVELGAAVTAYPVLLSEEQAALFDERVYGLRKWGKRLVKRSIQSVAKGNKTKINWILEFSEGFNGAPRANRVILSSHLHEEMLFPRKWPLKELERFGETIDVAFVAGLQSLKTSYGPHSFSNSLQTLCRQLAALRKNNDSLLLHLEYVPFKNKSLELLALKKVFRHANSLGINEIEVQLLCSRLGFPELDASKPQDVVRSALRVFEAFELTRLHVHSLGYHVFVLEAGVHDPEKSFEAAQFASRVASKKAGGKPKNPPKKSFDLVEEAASVLTPSQAKQVLSQGFARVNGHWLVIVPTAFVKKPKRTVGLGDVVSSTTLAFERATP